MIKTTQLRVLQYKTIRYFIHLFGANLSPVFIKKLAEHISSDLELIKEAPQQLVKVSVCTHSNTQYN